MIPARFAVRSVLDFGADRQLQRTDSAARVTKRRRHNVVVSLEHGQLLEIAVERAEKVRADARKERAAIQHAARDDDLVRRDGERERGAEVGEVERDDVPALVVVGERGELVGRDAKALAQRARRHEPFDARAVERARAVKRGSDVGGVQRRAHVAHFGMQQTGDALAVNDESDADASAHSDVSERRDVRAVLAVPQLADGGSVDVGVKADRHARKRGAQRAQHVGVVPARLGRRRDVTVRRRCARQIERSKARHADGARTARQLPHRLDHGAQRRGRRRRRHALPHGDVAHIVAWCVRKLKRRAASVDADKADARHR